MDSGYTQHLRSAHDQQIPSLNCIKLYCTCLAPTITSENLSYDGLAILDFKNVNTEFRVDYY